MPLRPLLVMQTGDAPEPVRRQCGNFDEMFYRMAELDQASACTVHVAKGEKPAAPQQYRGVIVTGSPIMVTDHETWSDQAGEWLCRAMDAGLPIFAVCYGHQLLAMCLGGDVGYHPKGEEVGSHEVRLTPQGRQDAFLADVPEVFMANMAHRQAVLAPPAGATLLAGSDHDPNQMLRYGDKVFTTQFHPEFGADTSSAYAGLFAKAKPAQAEFYRELQCKSCETPVARDLLRRFVRMTEGAAQTVSA